MVTELQSESIFDVNGMVIFYNSYICNGCLSVSLVPAHYKGEKKGKQFVLRKLEHTHSVTELWERI